MCVCACGYPIGGLQTSVCVWAECVGVVTAHLACWMMDYETDYETFWIMTRRLFGFPSAESCGFGRPKSPFQIVIVGENTFILMPHMWLTAQFRP